MTRLFRDAILAVIALAMLAGAAWAYLSTTTVTVRNKTAHTLSGVKIGFTGKELWNGDLEAGDSKWVFGLPNQDGSVEITYLLGNQGHEVGCGYVTGGPSSTSYDFTILPDGQSNCEPSN